MLLNFLKSKNRIISCVLCTVSVLLAALMIASVCRIKVDLVLYVDGNMTGAVSDPADVGAILQTVKADIGKVSYGESFAGCTITYGFAEGGTERDYLSEGEIYKALYVASLKNYSSAYGLYADGEFIAANVDPEIITDAVASARSSAQGENSGEVELAAALEVKSLYYPDSALYAGSEIEKMLLDRKDLYRAVKPDASTVISVDIDASWDETKFLGAGGGEIVSSHADEDGVLTVNIKVTESIPFITEYRKNPDLLVGTYEKSRDGADGKKEVIYRITYKDGVPEKREPVSEEIILEPLSKIIDEGTKTKPVTASQDRYIWPIKDRFVITDRYGGRELFGSYNFHNGIDLAVRSGTPVYAADGGVVIKSNHVSGASTYGYYVIIQHDNGQKTLYAHFRSEPFVNEGERVYQGQQIGEVGMTGLATGPHLHFEVIVNGEKVNPSHYLPPEE